MKATKIGPDHPRTTIDPILRTLCMQGEKAISLKVTRGGEPQAHFGTPAEPEKWMAWRTDAISIYLMGDLPAAVSLALGRSADVVARVDWGADGG